ncbi:hypothetical protein [Marinivivus vitaminiproducens]|uniref:hypothetical protein n=1 Tax=Marinivivus vitaminiproducens TaxID=3035935 RepID=UPI0027A02F06|nr:hypothetical protein P4R82_03735 [Geminicoccaceae bacterium SCSIO 64248]
MAAFVVTGFALGSVERTLSGLPNVPEITARLDALAAAADTIDVVVLGGSRSFRGLDPAVIDAEAARAGCPLRSFNFGIAGMNRLEQARIVETLAHVPNLRPAWLVIEALPAVAMTEANRGGARERALATPTTLVPALSDAWHHPTLAPVERLERLAGVLSGFASSLSGSGSLARLIFGEPAPGAQRFADARGFQALDDDPSPAIRERHDAFVADRAAFARALAESKDTSARPIALSTAHRAGLVDLLDRGREIAPNVALLLAPDTRPLHRAYAAGLKAAFANEAAFGALVDLAEPSARPELYAPGLWFDSVHLDAEGAAIASRLLAADLCRATTPDEPAVARLPLP